MEPLSASTWTLETSAATFQQNVVERSRDVPVVVDFWAPWCQPCRQLGPVLEKLAQEYAGRFVLVKADTEKLPEIAAGFGVQSIPAVYAVINGELVDYFQGALPEPQIRAWLERVLPSEADLLVKEATLLLESDAAGAEVKLRRAIELAPQQSTAKIALARLLVGGDRFEEASALLMELEARGFLEPEAEKLKAQLDLHAQGATLGSTEQCRVAVADSPDDSSAKLKLAEVLAAHHEYEEALQLALNVVQTDRRKFGEPARKLMVDIFRLLPEDAELLATYRRQLSMALY